MHRCCHRPAICLPILLVLTAGWEGRAADVLLVTANSTLTTQETQRKTRFEAWGHTVTTIEDGDSQANFDSAMASVDVVYVSEEVSASSVGYKLRLATVGVVSEERALDDEMGFSTANGVDWNGTTVTVTDNTHPITSSFSTGSLTIVSSTQTLSYTSGAEASGAQALISYGGAHDLAVFEVGAALANTYSSNSTAAGRRVRLPWGGDSFQASSLNSNGLLIAQNAIDWAATGPPATTAEPLDLLFVKNGATATTEEQARIDQFTGWGWTVAEIVSTAAQADYDAAVEAADVVYVSEELASGNVGYKLREAPIGVVVEERALHDEMGYATVMGSESDGTALTVSNNTHPITTGFSLAATTITTATEPFIFGDGTLAPGVEPLTTDSGAYGLFVIEKGGELVDTYNGSNTAAGRRVAAPWGGGAFTWANLSSDGLTFVQRSILWAASDGLVGHWKFDETSGTVAEDSSGSGNDGAYTGSPTLGANGVRGYAANLDGAADYVEVTGSDELNLQQSMTVACWAKSDTATWNSSGFFVSKRSQFILHPNAGGTSIQFYVNDGGWQTALVTPSAIDRWRHYAGVYDHVSGDLKIYIDGQLQATTNLGAGTTLSSDTGDLLIGKDESYSRYFDGSLDDVRLYNRALSDSEISELYGLVGHYKLDETSGTVAADSSGLGNDATYTNGPTLGGTAVRGNGAAFNSSDTNDRVDLPHMVLDGKTTYSLAWWVKSESTGVQTILSGANASTSNAALLVFSDDDTLETQVNGSANFFSVDSIATGRWNHFVYQHDRITGVEKVHMNGQLVGSTSRTSTTTPFDIDSGGLMLVQEQDSVGGSFDTSQALYGSLDDVRIYDRMLDDAEVAEIYGLIGHWKLDETSGTVAADSSGLGNDATYTTGP
ncbi:MAG: LamG domain-containing protein, partial [Planctomycetota bacterium]